jgi:hypothetical protein
MPSYAPLTAPGMGRRLGTPPAARSFRRRAWRVLLDIAPCTARHAFDLGDLGDLGMRRSVMWGQATDHASMSEYAATYDDVIILIK